MPKRILFVEVGPGARSALEAMRPELSPAWETEGVDSLEQARGRLAHGHWDGVAAGASLGDSAAESLLQETHQTQPNALLFRRAAAGQSPAPPQEGTPQNPHLLPAENLAEPMEGALQKAFLLLSWKNDPVLNTITGQMKFMPSMPQVHSGILKKMGCGDVDIQEVAVEVAHDPALCARLLRLANSAEFAPGREVNSAFEAVMLLGFERTRSLILFAQVFQEFASLRATGFSLDDLWLHSISTATCARWITGDAGQKSAMADVAFTAGLLHDIGKLLLAANLPYLGPQIAAHAREKNLTSWAAERELLGASHAEIGAYLLANWGLPFPILEAVAFYHCPQQSQNTRFCALTAVHVANALDHEKRSVLFGLPSSQVDLDYLAALGLRDRLDPWRELCGLDPKLPPSLEKA